jgi:hypothetical protein
LKELNHNKGSDNNKIKGWLNQYTSYFNISLFHFLRKCAAIRAELRLMGYPKTQAQIRNIPVGSESYYLCYPELCCAYGYLVKKNEAGEIIEIINQSEFRLKEEVQEFIDEIAEPDEDDYIYDKIYPTADPGNIELYVYADEKLDFQASESDIIKVIATIQAINEIENDSAQIFVTVTQITEWLERHRELYWSMQMDFNVLAFRPFQMLYCWLQLVADDFENMEKAQQAVDEYKPLDEDWLYKYDRLYYTATSSVSSFFEVFHESPFILQQHCRQLYLVGEEFKGLYEFPKLFRSEEDRERGKN